VFALASAKRFAFSSLVHDGVAKVILDSLRMRLEPVVRWRSSASLR